jgi:hypothetical protein
VSVLKKLSGATLTLLRIGGRYSTGFPHQAGKLREEKCVQQDQSVSAMAEEALMRQAKALALSDRPDAVFHGTMNFR